MEIGTILIAINQCFMDDDINHPTLTIGKEYEVIDARLNTFFIIDDEGDKHEFDDECLSDYFIVKEDDYSSIIDKMKKDIWQRILLLPGEKTSQVVEMQERTIYDNGDNFSLYIKNNELYNILDLNQNQHDPIHYTSLCIEDLIYLLEQWQ